MPGSVALEGGFSLNAVFTLLPSALSQEQFPPALPCTLCEDCAGAKARRGMGHLLLLQPWHPFTCPSSSPSNSRKLVKDKRETSPMKKGQSFVVNGRSSSLHRLESAQRDVVTLPEVKGGEKALLLFHKIVPISQLHEKGFVTRISQQWALGYRLCCCQSCTFANCMMLQSHLCLPTLVPICLATPSPGGRNQLRGCHGLTPARN